MADKKNLRHQSRTDWVPAGNNITTDELKIGCLQRIADACEKMAMNNDDLTRQRDDARRARDKAWEDVDGLRRTIAGLKGEITKLKKELSVR